MINQRLFPKWEEIEKFRNELTKGEETLVAFLDRELPQEWEIYVQPYLNNDRPDIVLLNPNIGLQIIEVKDWKKGIYRTQKHKVKHPKTGKQLFDPVYEVLSKSGWQTIANPVIQVERYRKNLIELYTPQLGEEVDKNSRLLGVFRISIYFHNMTTQDAKQLVNNENIISFGNDSLTKDRLFEVVPDTTRDKSVIMKRSIADKLRVWLIPPFHALEQGTDIRLTNSQLRYSKPTSGKKQALYGVPGSGKTLVLAQRAAQIAAKGKKALILTYNITLWHYIRDQIARAKYDFSWENIEIRHFHGFCWAYFHENNIPIEDKFNISDNYYSVTVPEKVIESFKNRKNANNRIYDAILIDEGQDYQELWYKALELFLAPNGEVLLAVDQRQNIYSRDLEWLTNRFEILPELEQSFRLPSLAITQANLFAHQFLSDEFSKPIQLALPFDKVDSHLIWRNVESFDEAFDRISKAVDWLIYKKGIHATDIVILVPNHQEGWKLVNHFEEDKKIKVNHVFQEIDGSKKHKHTFWMGDARLKMSTIHSFKGWELINVIILTPNALHTTDAGLDKMIYTALTRTRENLIVFNRTPKYKDFGIQWPSTWD